MGRKMIVRVEPQLHTVDVNGVNASHPATSLLKVIVLRTLYNSMLLINGRFIMRDTAVHPVSLREVCGMPITKTPRDVAFFCYELRGVSYEV